MFKKGPDIDKKKLLLKASDVKRDSFTRLKHFKTLIEHSDYNELPGLFKSHFSFIYHTFIDAFSTFDCNSKQRRDDLDCILFMLEKILIFNPELIKKRWQFYSITFVMQKLLHNNNTWRLRQEGVRLFVLWYLILSDETNLELQTMFGSLVPNLLPPLAVQTVSNKGQQQNLTSPTSPPIGMQHQQTHSPISPQISSILNNNNNSNSNSNNNNNNNNSPQVPIKLCSIDPLVPMHANEQMPNDEVSLYLDSLLQFMVTQTTKPCWSSTDDVRLHQELGFSFLFNMFKQIYLPHIFPDFQISSSLSTRPHLSSHSVQKYVDDEHSFDEQTSHSSSSSHHRQAIAGGQQKQPLMAAPRPLQINLRQQTGLLAMNQAVSPGHRNKGDLEYQLQLSLYQAIVIRWLTRIMRQDMIPGQDELIKSGSNNNMMARDMSSTQLQELSQISDGNSTAIFNNMETTSREMEVARRVAGTWPENIAVIHELFRRAFLNYHQPASMKRVVNVYKEWICNGGPNLNQSAGPTRNQRLGYTSFSDLLQTFVLNSSNAFVARVHNPSMLDEQVEMCKRIMNIYRYMVMKIYMNTATWEQLLNVMLSITERLFSIEPPERKEITIGGRIAPAFFQTFIVSWIRANLYVHISSQMWHEFHRVMQSLIGWRELIEEWNTTMGSLTRVLVKHVYGLNLTDLPLDKPQDRKRRPRAMKSFSTAESMSPDGKQQSGVGSSKVSGVASTGVSGANQSQGATAAQRPGAVRFETANSKDSSQRAAGNLVRSCSDGFLYQSRVKLYNSTINASLPLNSQLRRIKSEYLMIDSDISSKYGRRSSSPSHTDVMDATSLKDSNIIIEHDHASVSGDGHANSKSGPISSNDQKSSGSSNSRKQDDSSQTQQHSSDNKCVLLGGTIRGWTNENSVIMWRRMLGLFGNINHIEDPENHLVAIRCLASILCDFIKTRENLGVSLENQCSPEQPTLVPPYTYCAAWLLEATHLPRQYKESRLTAYRLLCLMSIRRHDMELPQQFYIAFYEALHRALASSDPSIHSSIIKNATQLLTLELPGCTFLVHDLYERSRSVLLTTIKEMPLAASPRDQAIQILASILSLHKPIKKLMVLKQLVSQQQDSQSNSDSMNLVASGDTKAKIMETLLQCSVRPTILDAKTRSKSLNAMSLHVYQELVDKCDSPDIERLFDTLLTDMQDFNNNALFRITCDLLRLFADHSTSLAQNKPTLVSSVIQTICQIVVRMSTKSEYKESIHCLLICLEDWCLAVGQQYLLRPVGQLSADDDAEEVLSRNLNESLITIVLRSLECVIHDEQYIDDNTSRMTTTRASISTSNKGSDGHSSSGRQSHSGAGLETSGFVSSRDRSITNEMNSQTRNPDDQSPEAKNIKAIKLACGVSHDKLLTYLGHFPLRQVGAASLSCCVSELDYLTSEQEFIDNKSSSNVVILVINKTTIVSLIGSTQSLSSPDARDQGQIHLIIRNLCGKYSWDAACLDLECPQSSDLESEDQNFDHISLDPETFQGEENSRSSMKYDSDFNDGDGNSSSSLSSRSSLNRDCIGDLLNQLQNLMAHGSLDSSCHGSYKRRNAAQSIANPRYKVAPAEETMIALLTNQRFQELNYCDKSDDMDRVLLKFGGAKQLVGFESNSTPAMNQHEETRGLSFEQCRRLVQHLGFLSWEKRCKVETLTKSARLLRELKNLDSQTGRETHKIAVLYVANGQEDKNSILTNSTGSRGFEDFVSGLGWEVNLASHLGFKGGLQSNKSTGDTSPYYCNGTTEVMFHVSTQIPLNGPADDESLNRKLRHLGNDEIHIVWSEHSRDYRRGIIPTEFGDVIIAIYPMLTFQGYFRIQISCKPDVPSFGPLFDNCIVHQTSLASLVRATAINASRAKRLKLPYYQSHFEERNRLIETIITNHSECQSFEEFAVQFYKTPNMISTNAANSMSNIPVS